MRYLWCNNDVHDVHPEKGVLDVHFGLSRESSLSAILERLKILKGPKNNFNNKDNLNFCSYKKEICKSFGLFMGFIAF